MPAQRVDLDEGSGISSNTFSTISTTDLRKIVSVSPAVSSLLPHLMRTLADEIESVSRAQPAPRTADLPQQLRPVDLQSIAHQVALSLSATLSRHLVRSLRSGPSDTPVSLPRTAWSPVASVEPDEDSRVKLATPLKAKAPAKGRLQLKLLGSPEIILDGVRLKALERCNRAALIIYILALHPRGLSVERLAEYMVSDSACRDAFDMDNLDANMGLGAVRTFIWRLRKLADWPEIVVSPGERGGWKSRYRLPDDTTCDLWEFEANLDEAGRLAVRANVEPEASDRAAALRQDAVMLYQGEFCKGVSAEALSQAAEYLRNRYLQAVLLQASYWKDKATRLQRARQETGIAHTLPVQEESAWLEALSNYKLAAQVEPYDEAAYAGAMLCQAHLGQSKGVQKTLARCTRVLNTELDSSPLPTTVRTARECLQIASRVNSL